jgi:hypothetical protein
MTVAFKFSHAHSLSREFKVGTATAQQNIYMKVEDPKNMHGLSLYYNNKISESKATDSQQQTRLQQYQVDPNFCIEYRKPLIQHQ